MSGPGSSKVSRRRFLRMAGIATGAVILAGCGGEKPTSGPPPTVKPTSAPVAEATSAPTLEATPAVAECKMDWNPTTPPFDKYSPEVEIAVPFESGQEFAYETDSFTNSPMYNRIVELLGIRYTVAWEAPRAEYYRRLNTDLAAGTLPDAFRCKNSALATFIDPGAVEDITELWDAVGSDLAKAKKGYPDGPIWRDVRRDGRVFGIAYLEDGYGSDSLTYIRQDWLDKLGLKAPSTLDEMTQVAREFKKAGLCEFPIAICSYLVTWDFGVDPVFGAFGVVPAGYDPGYWLKGDDGKLRYSSLEPGAREALAVLNTWYKEELINPDFVNQDESGPNDAFMAGQVGIAFQPPGGSRWNVPDLYSAFPEAKIAIIPNPAGPTGKRGRAGTPLNGNAVLFRKGVDPIKIEALIKHINWQIEMHVNFEKYQQYGEYLNGAAFFKGYEWDFDEQCNMVPGKTPGGGEWSTVRNLVGAYRGATYPDYVIDCYKPMATWFDMDPSQLNMAQRFIISDPTARREIEYYNIAFSTRDEIIPNAFQGPRTPAINEVLTDLLDYERTAFLEFITGSRPLDAFEAFCQEWLDRGGQVFTDEVNKWAAEKAV